jgi:hypothetical protein
MKHSKNERGQSTIEFIFTFAFGVCVIFLVFNSAINYVSGYLTHYATFMASRVYLVTDDHSSGADASISDGERYARETFENYALPAFNIKSEGFRINPPIGDADSQLTVGAVTVFQQKIDIVGQVTGQKSLEMVSESYLGIEPTRAQCFERTCWAMTGNTNCNARMDITLYDNGC